MSRTVAGSVLAESLKDWRPGSAEMMRQVDPWPAAAFAGLIGTPSAPPLGPGDPLPPMWHWFTLLDHPAQPDIGVDGHPASWPFLPPIPRRRRMFAGGRLRMDAHRIHYDRLYATQVEGYPDLVVHGPLLALLALELPRVHAPDRAVRSFDYRLVRPAFVPSRIVSAGRPGGSTVEVAVGPEGAGPSLTAQIGLG